MKAFIVTLSTIIIFANYSFAQTPILLIKLQNKTCDTLLISSLKSIQFENTNNVREKKEDVNLLIYPNPSNNSQSIDFISDINTSARIDIFDMQGILIKTFKNLEIICGKNTFAWDGTNNSGKSVEIGLYYLKLQYSNKVLTQKIIINK